jgi:hypothetical protein
MAASCSSPIGRMSVPGQTRVGNALERRSSVTITLHVDKLVRINDGDPYGCYAFGTIRRTWVRLRQPIDGRLVYGQRRLRARARRPNFGRHRCRNLTECIAVVPRVTGLAATDAFDALALQGFHVRTSGYPPGGKVKTQRPAPQEHEHIGMLSGRVDLTLR